ncbi:MAG TPA: hypothetical protein VFE61_27120 [Candidatus Sulfotelmatobacter sp.]|jgi:hypothetical protein|nr:hypothetical protein [Candidatus Sulfotelmatobacter sp.]
MRKTAFRLTVALSICVSFSGTLIFGQSQDETVPHKLQLKSAPPIVHDSRSTEARRSIVTNNAASGANLLPVFNYQVVSSRDGHLYDGVIVGANPGARGKDAQVMVTAQLIPVILKFHTIGTAVNLQTGVITTASGDTTSDPTMPDTGCFTGSVNVPVKLMVQSPILQTADFNFGGTDVGTTQYTDAVQRGSFWSQIDKANYHVLLKPVILAPLVIDVPAASGLALNTDVFAPFFSLCGPEGIVDISFLDAAVVSELTQRKAINPGTFPMFMMYNAGMSFGDPTQLGNCCAGGFHSINPAGPLTFQTFSPFDFDVSGLFVTSANDTAIPSHEVDEWANDPYVINRTPAWGHTGQVSGCQNNLEVGDPLTGSEAPRVVGKNGFTYHLQELAFFSWFFGNPSLAIHGWDSNNGTFLTDAGAPCQ